MTISRGSPYGTPAELPAGSSTAQSDADLAQLLAQTGDLNACFGLTFGDLLDTLGGGAGPSAPTHRFPVDLGWCVMDDGSRHPFVAHLVGKGRLWSGPCAIAMNATNFGNWQTGPKAHPNDGLLDITYGHLGWKQRLIARRRLPLGTHLPHPLLHVTRTQDWTHDFGRRRTIVADHQPVGSSRIVTLSVQSDAGCVVI